MRVPRKGALVGLNISGRAQALVVACKCIARIFEGLSVCGNTRILPVWEGVLRTAGYAKTNKDIATGIFHCLE